MESISSVVESSSQDAWRKPGRSFRSRLLKQDEEEGGNNFVLSPTCSIPKYFDVADRVLDQFLQHPIDSKEDLVEAYLVGNRLCRFLSNVLPTHPDYWSSDPEIVANRTKSHSQLVELMYFVKQLAVMIDEDEHQSYISRVLDSSSTAENSTRHNVIPSTLPLPSTNNGYSKSNSSTTADHHHHHHHRMGHTFPGAAETSGNTSNETDTESEARDPSLDLNEESVASEEIFDEMWAKVGPPTDNQAAAAEKVRTTRPMKDPKREKTAEPVPENSVDDGNEWHSFSEDMSWTKMSLSVSSSKFQSIAEEERRADFRPPQVVKSKRKKKKSKRQELPPIEDVPVEDVPDEPFSLPETKLERRLRRAQRKLGNTQNDSNNDKPYEEDYPPPPESDYPRLNSAPPREPPMGSPTRVLDEWPASWDDEGLDWDNKESLDAASVDDTKVSLMTDTEKSFESPSRRRVSRRQRAMKGLKCVKCLVEI